MDEEFRHTRLSLEITARQELKTTHGLHRPDEPALQMDLARGYVRVHLSVGADHQKFGRFYLAREVPVYFNRKVIAEFALDRRVGEQHGARCRSLDK